LIFLLLPFLLALLLVSVWVKRPNSYEFSRPLAAGLIGAMLATLPLRTVLVPRELD
jgi:hypothetical protein